MLRSGAAGRPRCAPLDASPCLFWISISASCCVDRFMATFQGCLCSGCPGCLLPLSMPGKQTSKRQGIARDAWAPRLPPICPLPFLYLKTEKRQTLTTVHYTEIRQQVDPFFFPTSPHAPMLGPDKPVLTVQGWATKPDRAIQFLFIRGNGGRIRFTPESRASQKVGRDRWTINVARKFVSLHCMAHPVMQ
jgi:hypothetical protein